MQPFKTGEILFSPLKPFNSQLHGGDSKLVVGMKRLLGFSLATKGVIVNYDSALSKARKQVGFSVKRWPQPSHLTAYYGFTPFLASLLLADYSTDYLMTAVKRFFLPKWDPTVMLQSLVLAPKKSGDDSMLTSLYSSTILEYAKLSSISANSYPLELSDTEAKQFIDSINLPGSQNIIILDKALDKKVAFTSDDNKSSVNTNQSSNNSTGSNMRADSMYSLQGYPIDVSNLKKLKSTFFIN